MSHWSHNRRVVYWGVALLSGLLSLYRILTKDLINGDGIRYIDLARTFLDEGIGAAFEIYHWPFYSILIGLIHKLTGFSFENSANLLNVLLLMLVCVVFVRIYEEISGKQARIWVAAIIILALPVLNDYRDLVIRGHGFWAFMLIAVYCFIRYSRSPGLRGGLKWQLSMAVAILFRVEGIVFLVLAPFCFLFMAEERGRIISHVVRLNSLFIILAMAAAGVMLMSGTFALPGSEGIPYQLAYTSPKALIGALSTEAEIMVVRNQYMAGVDEAMLILGSGVLALVFVKISVNAVLPFLAIWGYGVHRKWLNLSRESFIVVYFAAIGFLTLVVVAGNYFFVSSRYTVLTVLLISLVTFQYVDYLFRELSRRRLHKWNIAAWGFILILFLDGLISGGASKRDIRLAGEWVKAELAVEERIACNEARLEFYSDNRCKWIIFGEVSTVDAINKLKKEGYTYFLFWIDRKDEQLRSVIDSDAELVLEKEFLNKSGNSVRLYSVEPGRR